MTADNPTDTTDYVTNAAWLRILGRADAIDEIADQFERATPGAESSSAALWSPPTRTAVTRRPSGSQGRRPSRREVA